MKKAILRNKYAMPEEVIEKSVEEALEIVPKVEVVEEHVEEKPKKEVKKRNGRKLSI